jgi:hypothetical protein
MVTTGEENMCVPCDEIDVSLLANTSLLATSGYRTMRGRTGLASSSREETDFLFVSLSACAADQAGRSRSQTAGATRRCSSELENSMPRSDHLICACAWWIPPQNFFWKKSTMESRA